VKAGNRYRGGKPRQRNGSIGSMTARINGENGGGA